MNEYDKFILECGPEYASLSPEERQEKIEEIEDVSMFHFDEEHREEFEMAVQLSLAVAAVARGFDVSHEYHPAQCPECGLDALVGDFTLPRDD